MVVGKKIRVLIVDDSAVVRRVLSDALAAEPDFEVVGCAADPFAARDLIVAHRPDVLTLDIEMPRMDGLTFLRKLMRYQPMPVVVISSLAQASCSATLKALEEGAVEALPKPAGPYSVGDLRHTLAGKLRAAAVSRLRTGVSPSPTGTPRASEPQRSFRSQTLVAIGASTGGTEAVRQVLTELPSNFPPVVVTQHIPPVFSKAFSERLNEQCRVEVREAEDGDELRTGRVLVAPGGMHMLVRRAGEGWRVTVKDGPRVCYQRPSVDVLFSSVAEQAGARATGVILTGMGSDGASGMLRMREAGAATIAQNEETCVVFGMPREAIRMGAAQEVLPLGGIAGALLRRLTSGDPEFRGEYRV
jgi:two-component system chemotaxis response regulator CheB